VSITGEGGAERRLPLVMASVRWFGHVSDGVEWIVWSHAIIARKCGMLDPWGPADDIPSRLRRRIVAMRVRMRWVVEECPLWVSGKGGCEGQPGGVYPGSMI
jgi:hypothetical protein